MKKIVTTRVTVLYNLPEKNGQVECSLDDYDTYESAETVAKGLESAGYQVEMMGIDKEHIGDIRTIQTDAVFNLVEWVGKDSIYSKRAYQELENLRIPYTGSNVKGLMFTVDKIKMKAEFNRLGIRTPKHQIFINGTEEKLRSLKYPLIVKPAYEHCGIGVSQDSVVYDLKSLKRKVAEGIELYKQPILAEEYIEGRELQVTILETKGKPWILPPAEVFFADMKGILPIMTYQMKWDDTSPEFILADVMKTPKLPEKMLKEFRSIAKKCYGYMGARDYSRLDIRLRGDKVYILELNNNPGIDFEPSSGIAASAMGFGFSFEKLLVQIVENAVYRYYLESSLATNLRV